LISLLELNPGQVILDVGAGTGNYSNGLANKGYRVIAVEPSEVMLGQRFDHPKISWLRSFAEDINLDAESVDGALCVLSTHHFTSLEKAFHEIKRVLRPGRRLIIFSSDPRRLSADCWLLRYFDDIIRKEYDTRPPLNQLENLLTSTFHSKPMIYPFPIPHDVQDGFFFSAWREPERYLDAKFRNGISLFTKADESLTGASVERLRNELNDGTWDKLFSHVRRMQEYNGGYFFASVRKTK
jgi:SAM-dependent methyltransferase